MRTALIALMMILIGLASQASAQEMIRGQTKRMVPPKRGIESFYPYNPAVDPTGVRRRLNKEYRFAPKKRNNMLDDIEKALKELPRGRGRHGR
jgi:hypothetical protein